MFAFDAVDCSFTGIEAAYCACYFSCRECSLIAALPSRATSSGITGLRINGLQGATLWLLFRNGE